VRCLRRRLLQQHPTAQSAADLPVEVRDGLVDILAGAVNIRNRPAKCFKFGSERSEDAVTWTVFEGLRKSARLDRVLPPASRSPDTSALGALLAWGHPVAGSDAPDLAAALGGISQDLGERVSSRSEPDVVLVWPDLVVLVEVKLDSVNDCQPGHRAFPAYVDRDRGLYVAPHAVATAGFYELTRNWTIAARLAAKLDRRMLLINLGPPAIRAVAEEFSALLVQDDHHRFAHRTWGDVLGDAGPLAPWLADYVRDVGLVSQART
jgi:hypothetical protein